MPEIEKGRHVGYVDKSWNGAARGGCSCGWVGDLHAPPTGRRASSGVAERAAAERDLLAHLDEAVGS